MKKWYVLKGIKIALFVAAAILVFGYVVMSLWNGLVPALFHGPVIGWWQAIGLLVLSKILFGGMRGGRGHWGQRRGWYWRKRMEEKMASMTPEEREKFREQCYGYMGWGKWERKEETETSGTN
jgi:hypothetical protein